MSARSITLGGQRKAERDMADECRIERTDPNAPPVIVDGIETPAPPTKVYEGKCKVQTYEPYEQTPDVASQTVTRQRYALHVPVSAGRFEVGDMATITKSANLPSTLNRTLRVAGLNEKTWQTAQRLLVDEGDVQ